MTIERKYIPLLSGGIRDSAADQGGMGLTEALELENGFFNTPSSLTIRRGSVDGDRLLDDAGVPAPVTSIPFLGFFPDRGKIFAIGHSTATSKHYAYEVGTDGQNEASPGSDLAPIVPLPSPYDVALPVLFTGASWYNKRFYMADVAQTHGLFSFNGDTGTVDQPLVELGAGPPASLKPRKVFVHNNHLILLGYGDENMPISSDIMRSSLPGDPDTFDSQDFFNIGDNQEPLVNGLSLGAHAMLFKERRVHRLSGQVAANWAFPEIDKNRGTVNTRSAKFYEGLVWFLSEEGFARIGLNGPSELIVDKAKLAFASFDNFQHCWVEVNIPERMIVFACHEAGESGTFPNLLVQVDTRTLNWVVRDYLASGGKLFSMAAEAVPQVAGVAAALGPTGPPVLAAPTNITVNNWRSNWAEGDSSAGIRTLHQSRDTDVPAEVFIDDGAVDVGTLFVDMPTLKHPGAIYSERVRHEKNGIFSIFDTGEVKTLLAAPGVSIDAIRAFDFDVGVFQGNFRGGASIVIELQIAGSGFIIQQTILNAPAVFTITLPLFITGVLYEVRGKATRTGFADSAFSAIASFTPT